MNIRGLIFFGVFLSLGLSGLTQTEAQGDPTCVYKDRYPAEQRKGSYPFSKADSIVLVSYRYHEKNIPVSKDEVKQDSILEMRWIFKDEIDEITDILYNNFYASEINFVPGSKCYFPRNAILFYNGGKLFETVILCFSCDEYSTSSERVNMGDKCEQKMSKLRDFFRRKGISFGTDPKILSYPGETIR
jgi:hypothetical protein